MEEFSSVRQVKKSRKAGRCLYCREPVNVGEPKVVEAGKFDGCMWTNAYHPECYPVARSIVNAAWKEYGDLEGVDVEDIFSDAGDRARGVPIGGGEACPT